MPPGNKTTEGRFQLIGWLVFVVCSFFFIASGVVGGSLLGIIGSVLFLLACIIFLIPLVWKRD